MHIEQKVNIHNRFDIHIDNIETGEHREIEAYNIVLNQMWTRLCNGSPYFAAIRFGTGLGTPVATRTSLFTDLGFKMAADETIIKAVPTSSWKRKIILNPEEFVGSIITEVGIAFTSGDVNALVTHAMLKDSEGNPISITKTALDVVTIYATVFVIFVNMAGFDLISLPSNNTLVNYLIGGAAAPSGSFTLGESLLNTNPKMRGVGSTPVLGTSAGVSWTADVPNKKRKTNISRFSISMGNGHVTEWAFTDLFRTKIPNSIFSEQPYTGVIIGTGDGIKTRFQLPSKNVKQSSVVVKNNGSIVSNFIKEVVDKGPKHLMALHQMVTGLNALYRFSASKNGTKLIITGSGSWTFTNLFERDANGVFVASRVFSPSTESGPYSWIPTMSPDGNTVALFCPSATLVKIFDLSVDPPVQISTPITVTAYSYVDYKFSFSGDGKRMVMSYPNKIRVFDRSSESWVELQEIPWGGSHVTSMSEDGNTVVVATSTTPFFKVYDLISNVWTVRPNPAVPPTQASDQIVLDYDGNGLAFKYAANVAPYFDFYDWTEGTFVKRPAHTEVETFAKYEMGSDRTGKRIALPGENSPYMLLLEWENSQWVRKTSALFNMNMGGRGFCTDDLLITMNAGGVLPAVFKFEPSLTDIVFDTPPVVGVTITSDYSVEGVHKTDQYVIDTSFAIVFGEGV